MSKINGRGGRIVTRDPYVPNVVLYQSELHPESAAKSVLACHGELRQFAQTFFESGFGKGCQRSKRLIYLALSEARSVRKPPQACNGACDFGQLVQAAVLDGMPDHGPLVVIPVLHCVNRGKGGFSLRQVVSQVFPQARFIGLVVERVIDQLKCRTYMPPILCQRLLDEGWGVAQDGGDLRSCLEKTGRLE